MEDFIHENNDEKMAGMFIGIFAGMYYIYVGTRCRHDTSHEEV